MDKKQVVYEHSRLAIDLLPEEQVLNVQRQHPIALAMLFITHVLLIAFVFGILSLIFFLKLLPDVWEIFMYISLLFLSILAVIGTYTCMNWYFTFYIVTSKRLIIRKYFKVIGAYYQELYLRRNIELETKRVTANIVYDMLDIEDIYVTVHTEDIPEPFLFKTPHYPEGIEAALAEIETRMLNKNL